LTEYGLTRQKQKEIDVLGFSSSIQAALKQLARNKVPNMAVLLKSIIHTHADAKAVFRDPTGSTHTQL